MGQIPMYDEKRVAPQRLHSSPQLKGADLNTT